MSSYLLFWAKITYVWGAALTFEAGPEAATWKDPANWIAVAPCLVAIDTQDGIELRSEISVNKSLLMSR